MGLDHVLSFVETRPGEHPARRQALARHRAAEPGHGGQQAGGGAQGDARRGGAAAAGARASAGSQGPAAEGCGVLPRSARQGGERVGLFSSLIMKGIQLVDLKIIFFQTL